MLIEKGYRFYRLVVLDNKPMGKGQKLLCKCDCGKIKLISKYSLVDGKHATKSCSCYKKELLNNFNRSHGASSTRPYKIWAGIKKRCNNPNYQHYCYYGGRGITYDPKWETFEGFWKEMSKGYAPHLSIDRKDNNGNYSKENCHWATIQEQMNNHGHCTFVEIDGVKKSISDWCRTLRINRNTVYDRISHKGMTAYQAITTPIKEREVNAHETPSKT